MKIEHNSRNLFYRTPFGAAGCGTEITLSLAVAGAGIPQAVVLILEYGDNIYQYDMGYRFEVGEYSIYSHTVNMPHSPCNVWYYFEVKANGDDIWYANNQKRLGGLGEIYQTPDCPKFQITVFDPDYKTPDWFKTCVCYQIFPDRFCREGEFLAEKKKMHKRVWGDTPFYKEEQFGGEYDCSDFFGGNLKGIESKLDYLKDLGITAIYLNPIFEAASNHRYDTGDYEKIDPVLGTNEDFERLCKKAREKGIRIILDGVFNHTGSNSRYFNKDGEYPELGAYQSKDSEYYNWYRFSNWPEEYESWWGMKTLPQVEENNEDYQKYILTGQDAIVKRWLEAGASGWRIDVADELPDEFLKIMRREVKNKDRDAVIIGEVWEDASNKISYGKERQYLLGDELDSVMNYPQRNAFIDFALRKIDAKEFEMRIMSVYENYPKETVYSIFNILSTHDVDRILTALSGETPPQSKDEEADFLLSQNAYDAAKKRLLTVITMQMLMPGVPCVYYGDEIGMQGYRDPFSRGCFCADSGDMEIFESTKQLIALRKSSKAFLSGSFESLYAYEGGYAFLRKSGREAYIVAVNFGEQACLRIDAARFGITKISDRQEEIRSDNGIFYVNLTKDSARVFRV